MTGCQAVRSKKESLVTCEAGSYKPYPGEDMSDICPPYSVSLFPGSLECFLFSTTYGTKKLNTDHSGHQQCPEMILEYLNCLHNFCGIVVRFDPGNDTFQQTFTTMENLNPVTSYRLEVCSKNWVSSVAGGKTGSQSTRRA